MKEMAINISTLQEENRKLKTSNNELAEKIAILESVKDVDKLDTQKKIQEYEEYYIYEINKYEDKINKLKEKIQEKDSMIESLNYKLVNNTKEPQHSYPVASPYQVNPPYHTSQVGAPQPYHTQTVQETVPQRGTHEYHTRYNMYPQTFQYSQASAPPIEQSYLRYNHPQQNYYHNTDNKQQNRTNQNDSTTVMIPTSNQNTTYTNETFNEKLINLD